MECHALSRMYEESGTELFAWFQYDLSASQFSPDGRVFQIDYAGKAIEQSGTVIGLRGKNGVVLAVEKIVRSPLYEEDAGARIYSIDKHIGIVSIAMTKRIHIFVISCNYMI